MGKDSAQMALVRTTAARLACPGELSQRLRHSHRARAVVLIFVDGPKR